MFETFNKLGFKPGDTVKCTKSELPGLYVVGKSYKLEKHEDSHRTLTCEGFTGYSAEWEKVEEMKYEDQWHLNDGKVTIPDDADKLEKDGSVVAFRKRKEKDLEFGDELTNKESGKICKFIKYNDVCKKHITIFSVELKEFYNENVSKYTRT